MDATDAAEDPEDFLGPDRDALGRPLVVKGDPVNAGCIPVASDDVLQGWFDAISVKGSTPYGITIEGIREIMARAKEEPPGPS